MICFQKADKTVWLYTKNLILPSEPLHPLWNRESIIFNKPPKWNYADACMIKAVLMLYELCGDERLLSCAVRFTDAYVNDEGNIPTLNPEDFNLDNINGCGNLIYLFRKTGMEKYRIAFESVYERQLQNQPRLNCGNFFHKAIYPNQIWLDGTYMAFPFLAEYAKFSENPEIISDIGNQINNIINIMRDDASGLYKHGYDETHSMYWADSETGLSNEFWLRSMGWFCAALADLCELLNPDEIEVYQICRNALKDIINSLSNYITDENMLYQLPSKINLPGNYPETSGTLLFSYSAMKAYRLGICGEKIKADGLKTLSAVTENFIEIKSDDIPILRNICLAAGLGGNTIRNGSAEYYLSEPVVENDAKGIAPYLMAYCEMKKLSLNENGSTAELSSEAFADNKQKNHV